MCENLLADTYDMLDNRPRPLTFKVLAEKAKVSESWLRKFSQRKVPDPGVVKVQSIHNVLKAHQVLPVKTVNGPAGDGLPLSAP